MVLCSCLASAPEDEAGLHDMDSPTPRPPPTIADYFSQRKVQKSPKEPRPKDDDPVFKYIQQLMPDVNKPDVCTDHLFNISGYDVSMFCEFIRHCADRGAPVVFFDLVEKHQVNDQVTYVNEVLQYLHEADDCKDFCGIVLLYSMGDYISLETTNKVEDDTAERFNELFAKVKEKFQHNVNIWYLLRHASLPFHHV
ncbi:unnamed protein product [Bursaphelenchus okinawaensis]|uniref:Uncharacterized protein n=1 Tax=Bursaphelenchus okinawaensis TaxID=465554 RepID=A0A811L9K5_9BILA|nr:unnamed protein product [Bursaphelenchus okinawaensis]CAG9118842.1 unnamed protein product [Bursaphelenchus okinawaensis]